MDIEAKFLLISIVVLLLFCYNKIRHNFWSTKGVHGPKPTFFIGNVADLSFKKVSRDEQVKKLYNSTDAPYIGIYKTWEPTLLLRDPELIKYVLSKNFQSFANRGTDSYEKIEPLSANLFNLEFKRWIYIRSKITPIFNMDQMKSMYPRMEECGNDLQKKIATLMKKNDVIECHELAQKYTFDVIVSCLFAVDANKMEEEKEIMREIMNQLFSRSTKNRWRRQIATLFPVLSLLLKIPQLDKSVSESYEGVLRYFYKYRESLKIQRNDLINLLLTYEQTDKNFESTLDFMAVQCFLLAPTGMEMSGSTISFALEELAQVPSVQEKLRSEIIETAKEFDGKITYDALLKMDYLHRVVQETLRKHSPLFELIRESTEHCSLPDGLQLPPRVKISIPIRGIHYDPKYYENPDVFDPERFTEEACRRRPDMSFIPFGYGPRNCIGLRFAYLQTKMGLVKILEKYRVSVNEKIRETLATDKQPLLFVPGGRVDLKISRLEE